MLADCTVTPRFVASVNELVACNVPPFNVSRSATSVAAAPRLLSLEMATVPAEIVVLPVKVLDPESVSVELLTDFTNAPAPEMPPANACVADDAKVSVLPESVIAMLPEYDPPPSEPLPEIVKLPPPAAIVVAPA